jgi:bifunctional non-homologous end joining protein LigD
MTASYAAATPWTLRRVAAIRNLFFTKWGKPAKARRPVGFIEPCIPTSATKVPDGPMWLHEIKHDGFRLVVWKAGNRVRLFTRRGLDWSEHYPRIFAAAQQIKGAFVIDGEAVVPDERGIANFEMLHSRKHDQNTMMWGFDLLQVNGEYLRVRPLEERKQQLAELLKRAKQDGLCYSDHVDENGPAAFALACRMGLEGIVSKRRDSRYISGRSKSWLKIKNPDAPGVTRFREREVANA